MNKYCFNIGMPKLWLPPKILLIMRLIIVIMTTCFLQVSASSFGQRISLSEKDASLEQVLQKIKLQTGVKILYADYLLDQAKKVNIKISNVLLPEALSEIFENQAINYELKDNTIFLTKKEPSFLQNLVDRFNNIDVHGKILDSEGKGLPGASVKVKSTGKAVSTDANGNFFLRGVEEGAVLIVSFIGYLPKEVNASANMGNVVLEQSLSKLDEVQVIAYGTTTQRLSTGNVTTIKADVIEKQPVNNPLLALQGRVPGLFIEQATGFAGTGVKVRIQGTNSLLNGNDPLYVIDGIPFTSQLLSVSSPILGSSGGFDGGGGISSTGNPLSFINPTDIESIDVLKDADATAIYGSRAANGAILITTKKGKSGDVIANVNLQTGFGRVGQKLELMNAQQYLEMRREAFKNDGLTIDPIYDYDLNGVWDNSRNTDWQKELIGGTAAYHDLNASLSGGSNTIAFLAGAGYHEEGNVFPGNFLDSKKSVHFNLNSISQNQKFKFQFSGSYLQDNNSLPGADLTKAAMTLWPVAPNLYNADGSINWAPNSNGETTFEDNPISYTFEKFKNTTTSLIGNTVIGYQISPGLEIKSSFGYNKLFADIIDIQPPTFPESQAFGYRPTIFSNSNISSWSIEPQINYHRNISKGKLEILIGSTFQSEQRNLVSINASGFNSDQVMQDIKSATALSVSSSGNSVYKYTALFGRLNYNWKDKYIINITARRDGSSRFGSENRFHSFGAIGGAWIFSEENFIKNHLAFLSYGKLRSSYGTTGSDQIPDYQFLSLYNNVSGTSLYQGAPSYRPSRLTNPLLQWEETRKLQIGLDLGFLHDRLLLNVNYSRNRSSNQLLVKGLPITTGFINIQTNIPATIQNTGWELSLSTTNLNVKNFKWTTNFNLTLPKNKLVNFPDFENSGFTSLVVGESINIIKLYHFLGVDPATGVYQFADRNNNPTTNPLPDYYTNNDLIRFINPDPKFYGGFQNTFVYKGLQLDVLFQFTKQMAQNYSMGMGYGVPGRFEYGNQPTSILDRWQKPGDISTIARYNIDFSIFGSVDNAQRLSDANWSDASYIRLKNVSLSWQLPKAWEKAIHLRNFKLYVHGQNLFTITNYLGLDPESKSSITLPPLRVIAMGVQVGI